MMRSLAVFFLCVLVLATVVSASISTKRILGRAFKFIGSAALSAQVAWADAIPLIGTNAPDFTLQSNAGKSISLNDLKGKRTVLYFYPVSTLL